MAQFHLSELCEIISQQGFSARLVGMDCTVGSVNTLEDAGPGELTFLSNPKYLPSVAATRASAVVLKEGLPVPDQVSTIRCEEPYAAIAVAIVAIHGHRRHPRWGISQKAVIDPSATVGESANIGPCATISAGARIGARCCFYPGSFVGERTVIGDDCTLFPNVVVYDGCEIGNRVTIHAGSVIGEDGLGYVPHKGCWTKIPQAGTTVIGDDVEIGANCTIDRATLGRTEIGSGSKFGNVVVVGHGTKIGSDCLFVGLVGIAGSVNIGNHVMLAGQVGIAGHISIGNDAKVGAQAGIINDIAAGSVVIGSPAMPEDIAKRSIISVQRLPDMMKRVRSLEEEVRRLRARVEQNGEPRESATPQG